MLWILCNKIAATSKFSSSLFCAANTYLWNMNKEGRKGKEDMTACLVAQQVGLCASYSLLQQSERHHQESIFY